LSEPVIETDGLRKSYGAKAALRGLELIVPRGSIYGFLGRNGAGKTTTLKLLMGILGRDGGDLSLFGEPMDSESAQVKARRRIGFVSEDKELYPFMTVEQTIRFTQGFFPGWRRELEERYLKLFRLPPRCNVLKLSKGMRTQLMMLLAMARGADLLVMDEPTTGLDPIMTEEVLQALADLAAGEGVTIFFSSHQLTEVEQICDHVCLIDDGQKVLEGELDELKSRYRRIVLVFDSAAPSELAGMEGIANLRRSGRTASMLAHVDVDNVVARTRKFAPQSVEVHPLTLKELFLDHLKEE